jgi:hypothetical protein
MADDERWQPFGKPHPPAPPVPGEAIWTVTHDHIGWSCELRFEGESYGWDARIFRAGDFFGSHRFILRAAAERWANEWKQLIEKGWQE